MLKVGENIVYGSSGVMTIVDIRSETIGGVSREYYVLKEYGKSSDSYTFVPSDSEKLVSLMRPLLTREEIMSIITSVSGLDASPWIRDSKARSQKFREIIESGDRAAIISMIKAIYEAGRERCEQGKKNYLADESAMRRAEKLIYSEFSAVLGIPEEEMADFIAKNIEKKA